MHILEPTLTTLRMILIPSSYTYDQPLCHNNMDPRALNSNGKELLSLCMTGSLCIINGCKFGDTLDKHTRCNKNAATPSSIDYVIRDQGIFDIITMFHAHELSYFSDHCQLSFST